MCLYFSVGSPLGAAVVMMLQTSAPGKPYGHFLKTWAEAVLIIRRDTCVYNRRLTSCCSSPRFTCTWQPTQGWEVCTYSFSLLNDFMGYSVPPFVILDFWIQAHQQNPMMAWFSLEKSKTKERKNRVGFGRNKGGRRRKRSWKRYQQH